MWSERITKTQMASSGTVTVLLGTGTYDGPINTNLGKFYTPVAETAAGYTITYNNVPIGNFGVWQQQITSLQRNSGTYFGGLPTTYGNPALWKSTIDGTFKGTATGFIRSGYYVAGAMGTVNITITNGSASVVFNIHDLSTGLNSCTGNAAAGPQGFTVDCTGSASDSLYTNTWTVMPVPSFDVSGNSQSMFLGTNAPAISGVIAGSNIQGLPDGGVQFVVSFGACNVALPKCSIQ